MKIVRPATITDSGSFTRASAATYWDKNGALQTAAIDVPRYNYNPADLTIPPTILLEAAATNLLLNSATVANQSITTTAQSYTLSFYGTGTVVLSGSATGTLVGTSATARASLTVVASAGSVALTVTGSATNGQFESGTVSTSRIVTTGSTATRSADVNTSTMLSNVPENDHSAWSASTVYVIGDAIMVANPGEHKNYESLVGISATATITINTPALVTVTAHGQVAGNAIQFSTTGTLPTGITAGTIYYLVGTIAADTFNIAATVGGAAINTSISQSGVHTARISSNFNKTPAAAANPTVWLDIGSTNRWKMWDLSVESQTTNTDFINVTIPVTTNLIDCSGFLNIDGYAGRVVMTDPVEGVVFDSTFTLVSDSGITDPYAYCFEPIVRLQDYFLTGLYPYLNATLSITIADTGSTANIGVSIPGLSRTLGPTQSGLTFGIQDYSTKTRDSFGNSTIVERGYNVRTSMSVWVDNSNVNYVGQLLASLRATPILYVGNDLFNPTMAYGYYKDYNVGIDYTTVSVLHIELEGLK